MLQEIQNFYQKMIADWTKNAQPIWFDFLKSEFFLNWMKLFHIYYFGFEEKTAQIMEQIHEKTRIASKEDIKDLVDAQRLLIDMVEELTDRIEKIEKNKKG